ncbi:hypothetical protein SMICM17S_09176 [Streptomyces microflavus]
MEAAYGGARGEPLDLPLPVAHQRGRAHHQRRPGRVPVALAVQMQGDEGDCFTQAHVVGEAGAEAERGHGVQPVQTAQLIVAQCRGQRLGLADRLLGGGLRIGQALSQLLQPAGRRDLHPAPVHLGGAGQRRAQRVHGRDLAVLGLPGPPRLLRVDEDPLVAQPNDRPARLREPLQLLAAQLLVAQGEPPVEREEGVGGQERRGVRGDPPPLSVPLFAAGVLSVGRADHRACGQLPRQLLGPVHLHTRGGQSARGGPQQFGDLLVGRLHRVRHRGRQKRRQRRPGTGGAAQGEEGVHPGPRPERRGAPRAARPYLGRVGDQGGVADAVDLQHGAERRPRTVVKRGFGTRRGCSSDLGHRRCRSGDLDTQREPYARVVTGRHIGRPGPPLGQVLRLPCGERGARRGEPGGGRPGQPVRHRVQERPQQPLRFGQQQRPVRRRAVLQRGRVGGGRHRRREFPDPLQVPGAERPDPPGVLVGGAQARQQKTPGDELQAQQCGGAPEGGRGGGLAVGPRPCQHRQGLPYGKVQGGHGTAPEVGPDHDELRRDPGRVGRGATVRVPEGDQAGTGRIRGDEDRGAAGQLGNLGRRCRGVPVHSVSDSSNLTSGSGSPRVLHPTSPRAVPSCDLPHFFFSPVE